MNMNQDDKRHDATAARGPGRLISLLIALRLLLAGAAPLAAQNSPRMWAAQTGLDLITLAWDSIPGAAEYRIYLGSPGTPGQMPAQRLGGGARRAAIVGMQRASNGVFLVAIDATGHRLQQAQFNQVTPATMFPPIVAPVEAAAEATSANVVTLSWTPVPGATAYYIGRAVAGSGFRPLCELCSTNPTYVDRSALPGLSYGYTIAAIFPNGTSRRIASNQVTPGAAEVAAAYPQQASATYVKLTPPPTTSTTTASTSTTTTSTTTTTSQTSPTTALTTAVATTASNVGTLSTSSSPITQTVGTIAGNVAGVITPVNGVTGLSAAATGPGAVRLSWQPSTTAGVTDYIVNRRINGGAWNQVNSNNASTFVYSDVFFPVTMFAQGPVRVSYNVVASKSGTLSPAVITPDVIVQPPTTSTQTTATTCKLDYMRADNMWAAFGRPDGLLGTESISLASLQDKVFITDWAYEKQRSDGTNYYGSHLRIATNNSSHTIRLQLRSFTLTGLVVWVRTGTDTFWIRMAPGTTQQFQADLMEVFCEN